MPVHKRTFATDLGSQYASLLDALKNELRNPKETGEPLVIEDETPQTRSIRIYVIWDRWEECAPESRSQIIQSAYGEVRGPDVQEQITLALGVTRPEAVSMGLLPFKVLPVRKQGETPTNEEYLQAMLKAGAKSVPGSPTPELRFTSYEDAEACYESLENALPDSKWVIAQEVIPAER